MTKIIVSMSLNDSTIWVGIFNINNDKLCARLVRTDSFQGFGINQREIIHVLKSDVVFRFDWEAPDEEHT